MNVMILFLSLTTMLNLNTSSNDVMEITNVIYDFSKSADERNVSKMESILHKDFRAIVNQAFGSKEIQMTDKATYIDLLNKKIIGGDSRTIQIESIDMEGVNAVVKVQLKGSSLIFTTFIQLVKNSTDKWQVISDMPMIQKV